MIGKNIREFRLAMQESQSQLAKSINKSQKTISAYERNDREPDIATLKALTLHFGCTYNDLLKGV